MTHLVFTMSEPQLKLVDTASNRDQDENVDSGASTPTEEFVVVVSAAEIEGDTSAEDISKEIDPENPVSTDKSATEPSPKDDSDAKETSSATTEEKPATELEYHYECKFLEERYIKDAEGNHSWQIIDAGTAPPPDPPAPDSSKYSNYPLCLITEWDSENKRLTDRKLQAKSKALKRVIRRCLGDKDSTWKVDEEDTMESSWPWEGWFRGLDCFKAEKARLEGLIEKKGGEKDKSNKDWEEMTTCGVLIDTLETYHASTIKAMNELIPRGFINYEILWTLFDSYQELYMFDKEKKKHRCFEFKSSEYYRPSDGSYGSMKIAYRHVDYDGTNFGYIDHDTAIPEFRGRRRISSLPIFPLRFHPNKDALRASLVATGRNFESMRDTKYMRYGPPIKPGEVEGISQRVMVDVLEYENRPSLDEIIDLEETSVLETLRILKSGGYRIPSDETEDESEENLETEDTCSDEKKYIPLDDCLCVLTNNTVGAFNFNNKQWMDADVNQLTSPTWNQNAFDFLVLDEKKKELVRALVEQHIEDSDEQSSFDDFIPGKGKGLVYVLHGPPGVGKTLTAEAVSEYTKSPLYAVSAGELGTTPCELETDLARIFELAARWNCVVLLDEADVFMEARGLHEIERNASVSVFLKVLEYYKGIIFLTTNRVVSFDDAFRSRIHIALRFGELDLPTRTKIWQTFVNRIRASGGKLDLSDEDVLMLAERQVNGREIKNAIKSAQSLAKRRGELLNVHHLIRVLEIQQAFLNEVDSGI